MAVCTCFSRLRIVNKEAKNMIPAAIPPKKRYSEILELKGQPTITLFNSDSVVHKLSHQHLFTKFWIIEIDDLITNAVPVSELGKYPVPVLISTFMNAFKF